jgi:hypothetical protein
MPAPQISGGSSGASRCGWRGDGARSSEAHGTRVRAARASVRTRLSSRAAVPAAVMSSVTEPTPARGAVMSSTASPATTPTRLPLPGRKN